MGRKNFHQCLDKRRDCNNLTDQGNCIALDFSYEAEARQWFKNHGGKCPFYCSIHDTKPCNYEFCAHDQLKKILGGNQ